MTTKTKMLILAGCLIVISTVELIMFHGIYSRLDKIEYTIKTK